MIKKSLLLGAIASIIAINSVFADTIVTSQSYVDNRDALKQDKITAGTTGNVVTYNGTQNGQAQFSERAIFDPETSWDDEYGEIVSGHEGDLVTAGVILPAVSNIMSGPANTVAMYGPEGFLGSDSRGIYDGSTTYDSSTDANKLVTASVVQNATNLPETASTNKVCVGWEEGKENAGDYYCILWNLVDTLVYGFPACETREDCNDFARSCPMRMATCSGWPSHCECWDGTLA
jgi:hypothetical protein